MSGELRMAELTYQVDQLEKAGLIRRSSCPTDERGVVAALTGAGWDKLRQTAPGHALFVRERFIEGLDPATLTGLAEGLRDLAGMLGEDAPLGTGDTERSASNVSLFADVPPEQPVTLPILVRVACLRWPVEEDFEFGKDHFGLDHSRFAATPHCCGISP